MEKELTVKIHMADAGPVGWIAYAIAIWIAWAVLCGFVSDKAYLFMLNLSGWAFFVAGLFGILMAVGGIVETAGMHFPLGKPLIKEARP